MINLQLLVYDLPAPAFILFSYRNAALGCSEISVAIYCWDFMLQELSLGKYELK